MMYGLSTSNVTDPRPAVAGVSPRSEARRLSIAQAPSSTSRVAAVRSGSYRISAEPTPQMLKSAWFGLIPRGGFSSSSRIHPV